MIKSAPFSFVRFEHPADNDYSLDIPYSLPAFDKHNIAFQFIVDDDRDTAQSIKLGVADIFGTVATVTGSTASIVAFRYKISGLNSYSTFTLNSIQVDAVTKTYGGATVTPDLFRQIMFDDFGIGMTGEYFVLNDSVTVTIGAEIAGGIAILDTINTYWHQGFVTLTNADIVEGECFSYALLNADDTVLGYSNAFKVEEEEAFTSVASYYGSEDAFNFYYPDSTKQNIIRLPIFLQLPQNPKTRNIDVKSDGTKKVLSSFVEKEYQVETEQMPEVFHECLAVMLSHDNISIHNVNIRELDVDVIESDNYSVTWETEDSTGKQLPFGKGKGKIKIANFGYTNSNC